MCVCVRVCARTRGHAVCLDAAGREVRGGG